MAFNREQRRKTALKGKTYQGELTHQLLIADLKVYTNKDMPDGVMIVSPTEAERLQAIVDGAVAKKASEKSRDHDKMVFMADAYEGIDKVEKSGVKKVTNEEYAFFVSPDAVLEVPAESYPLEVIISETMPADTLCMVAKREGK